MRVKHTSDRLSIALICVFMAILVLRLGGLAVSWLLVLSPLIIGLAMWVVLMLSEILKVNRALKKHNHES